MYGEVTKQTCEGIWSTDAGQARAGQVSWLVKAVGQKAGVTSPLGHPETRRFESDRAHLLSKGERIMGHKSPEEWAEEFKVRRAFKDKIMEQFLISCTPSDKAIIELVDEWKREIFKESQSLGPFTKQSSRETLDRFSTLHKRSQILDEYIKLLVNK